MMKQRLGLVCAVIQSSFPTGTRVNDPPAGYTLWVELPGDVDTMVLFALCKAQGITVVPGQLFYGSHRYRYCLRLSFTGAWRCNWYKACTTPPRQCPLKLPAPTWSTIRAAPPATCGEQALRTTRRVTVANPPCAANALRR